MNKEPIENIEWIDADELAANNWNPNVVFNQELRLLELSILTNGWIQPIIVSKDNTIIDGFHRYMLSTTSPKVMKKYEGKVPVVRLDMSDADAMLLTVRINRAKGSHVSVKMADLVQTLHNKHNLDFQQIAKEIGATKKEVELLYENSLFKQLDLKNYKYNKAWIPADTKHD
jgi:ParB-like chromosome segregation protein Spo0J